ncbi:hypothetical protein [Desulfosarcina ovata]|nr:hypothetical protein [Desulfosarcina ovata]
MLTPTALGQLRPVGNFRQIFGDQGECRLGIRKRQTSNAGGCPTGLKWSA